MARYENGAGLLRSGRIYLFGSVARGDAGADSDLAFCVVLPDSAREDLYGPGVYGALWGVDDAADVVAIRASEFNARAVFVKASLQATVLREGQLVYGSGGIAA